MTEYLYCPGCQSEMKRQYGLPAILYKCKCGLEWVFSLGKLISRQEFLEEADKWHGV